jgi:hypothetical protein
LEGCRAHENKAIQSCQFREVVEAPASNLRQDRAGGLWGSKLPAVAANYGSHDTSPKRKQGIPSLVLRASVTDIRKRPLDDRPLRTLAA